MSDVQHGFEDGHRANSLNLAAVRKLISSAFTAKELWRLCQTHPDFRPVLDQCGPNSSIEDLTDVLTEYCRTKLLFPKLLSAICEVNPQQYWRYYDQLHNDEAFSERADPSHRSQQHLPDRMHSLPLSEYKTLETDSTVTQNGFPVDCVERGPRASAKGIVNTILPPLTREASFYDFLKTFALGATISIICFLLAYLLSNRQIKFMGLATRENGQAEAGLLIVAFVDGLEVGRTVSYDTKWNGIVPTLGDLDRGANFELNVKNVFGYRSNLFDFVVFIPAKQLQVGMPKQYVTPSHQQLQLIAIASQATGVNPAQPLRLLHDGAIAPIPIEDPLYALDARLDQLAERAVAVSREIVSWSRVLGVILTAVVGIASNIIASFLQEKYGLIDNKVRFGIVTAVFIVALLISTTYV